MEDLIASQIRDELTAIRKALEAIAIIMYQNQSPEGKKQPVPKVLPHL